MNGVFQVFDDEGKVNMIGNYKDDQLDGKVKVFYKFPLLKVEKSYKDGKENGNWFYRNEIGKIIKTEKWSNGILENFSINEFNSNTNQLEQQITSYIINGEIQKQQTKKYNTDEILELEFESINGIMNGILKTYFKSGVVERECEMKNGVQHGQTKIYNEKGDIVSQGYFKDGELIN